MVCQVPEDCFRYVVLVWEEKGNNNDLTMDVNGFVRGGKSGVFWLEVNVWMFKGGKYRVRSRYIYIGFHGL